MGTEQLPIFKTKKFNQIVHRQTGPVQPPTAEATVMSTLATYHTYLASSGYSKYTPDDFTADVKKFSLFVPGKKIKEITHSDIQQWIATLKSPKGNNLSPKTVSRKLTALQNYFLWLLQDKILTQNPMEYIQNHRIISPLPDILFENDCKKLLETASSNPRTYLLFLLILETGIKKEELMELTIHNFDFSNKYSPELWIKHTGKKIKKDRKVKLPAHLQGVFTEYINKYAITNILFPYTPRFIEQLFANTAKHAGITKKVSAQILRDTFAVQQLQAGEDIERVLAKLGLSNSTWEDAKEKYRKLTVRAL